MMRMLIVMLILNFRPYILVLVIVFQIIEQTFCTLSEINHKVLIDNSGS